VVSSSYEFAGRACKRYLHEGGFVDVSQAGWYVSGVGPTSPDFQRRYMGLCVAPRRCFFAGCHFTGIARVNVVRSE